jgi:hypothetical protein
MVRRTSDFETVFDAHRKTVQWSDRFAAVRREEGIQLVSPLQRRHETNL